MSARTKTTTVLGTHSVSRELTDAYAQAGFWHGTGRYAYRSGACMDILRGILEDGGLIPHIDDWDQKRGASLSISVAPARVYARLYAELYRYIRERNILQAIRPRLVWSAYFFLSSKWVAWCEYTPFRSHIPQVRKKSAEWTKRLARKSRSFTGAFLFGASDIPGNYPILIGIRPNSIRPTTGSRFIDLHEKRSSDPIPLSSCTHIEVPHAYISRTETLLAEYGVILPVLPIEEGDAYCWHFPFRVLASGSRLVSSVMRRASAP